MEIVYNQDKFSLLQEEAKVIEKKLKLAKDKPVLLMLSGGSSLEMLDYISTRDFKENVTIAQIDERFSKKESELNSHAFLNSDFFKKIQSKGIKFMTIDTIGSKDEKAAAKKYEKELKKWFAENPENLAFGVFGVGRDGHTAGVMPYPENEKWFNKTFSGNPWVVGYNASGKNPFPKRTTVTLSFIEKKLEATIVFAVGSEKEKALNDLAAKNGSLAETPVRVHKFIKNSTIFTDIHV